MNNGRYRNQNAVIFCDECGKKTNPAKCTYLPTKDLRFCSKRCKKSYKKRAGDNSLLFIQIDYPHTVLEIFPPDNMRVEIPSSTVPRLLSFPEGVQFRQHKGEIILESYPCADCGKKMTSQTQPENGVYVGVDRKLYCSRKCLGESKNLFAQGIHLEDEGSPYFRNSTQSRKRLTKAAYREILNTRPKHPDDHPIDETESLRREPIPISVGSSK